MSTTVTVERRSSSISKRKPFSFPSVKRNPSTASTLVDNNPDVDSPNTTTYHIYHSKSRRCYRFTQHLDPKLERSLSSISESHKRSRHQPRRHSDASTTSTRESDGQSSAGEKEENEEGYILHLPVLTFHSPPRILYRGVTIARNPVCIIDNSFCWRKWTLLFGGAVAHPGAIDPRGVVSRHFHTPKGARGDLGLRGYGVRGWRFWGESGKSYHAQVRAERRRSAIEGGGKVEGRAVVTRISSSTDGEDTLPVEEEEKRASPLTLEQTLTVPLPPATTPTDTTTLPLPLPLPTDLQAAEAVHLRWTSPLSSNTRAYSFTHSGHSFAWKGTGTLKPESKWGGVFLRFHHLKLVVGLPLTRPAESNAEEEEEEEEEDKSGSDAPGATPRKPPPTARRELVLGTFTSSCSAKKVGTLRFYDAAIATLLSEPGGDGASLDVDQAHEEGENAQRLHDIFVATAACMMVGEWQKRETVKGILCAAAEGGGGAGG